MYPWFNLVVATCIAAFGLAQVPATFDLVVKTLQNKKKK